MACAVLLVSLALVFYGYFGYPLSLCLLSLARRRVVLKSPVTPRVTFIITAFNEERRIRQKLDNTVALAYPRHLLQVVVASDGSTDATNDIVREYAPLGVQLLEVAVRGGK